MLQAWAEAPTPRTLLEQALNEGVADFVGEKVSGQLATGEAYTWAEFQASGYQGRPP